MHLEKIEPSSINVSALKAEAWLKIIKRIPDLWIFWRDELVII
jgi:hypothetical protein